MCEWQEYFIWIFWFCSTSKSQELIRSWPDGTQDASIINRTKWIACRILQEKLERMYINLPFTTTPLEIYKNWVGQSVLKNMSLKSSDISPNSYPSRPLQVSLSQYLLNIFYTLSCEDFFCLWSYRFVWRCNNNLLVREGSGKPFYKA